MKTRSAFACRECGSRSPKWMGRCDACGEWNTMVEVVETSASRGGGLKPQPQVAPLTLADIPSDEFERRILPGTELNLVLGGGLVKGSLVLLGGDPGVGKSTLMLQAANALAAGGARVLYVTGEESMAQVALRARRLELGHPGLLFLAETDLARILGAVDSSDPDVLVVDSIQSVNDATVPASPGTVGQLRECTLKFMRLAKGEGIACILIGHVTKEGIIAGPKLLEHMVDTVLYLEGERFQSFRLLRGVKNRFGSTNEVGVYEMRGEGLVEVPNPSLLFLGDRGAPKSGSAVAVTMEGTRPLLLEVQALACRSGLAVPRRVANGMDYNRLLLLAAVLGRRVGLGLYDQDIYVNVVGGYRVEEPAADLGVSLSIISSFRDRRVDPGLVAIGEVGLSAEIRPVAHLEKRLAEASKLGFKRALVPGGPQSSRSPSSGDFHISAVSTVAEAAEQALL